MKTRREMVGNSLLTYFLLLSVSGCSVLRPDPAPPAFESNYPTAEFKTKNGLHHGSGEVLLNIGQPYNEINLKIQGYYDGTVRIDSDRCDIGQSYTYTDSELFEVEIYGEADESCIIDFTVQPRFPNEAQSGQVIHEFKGRLLIKVLEKDQAWWGKSSKVKEGINKRVYVPFQGTGKAKAAFRGCGTSYEKFLPIKDNLVELSAEDILGPIEKRTCSLEGVILKGKSVTRVSWTIWGYAKEFPPLPIPSISSKKPGKTKFIADEAAATVSLDREYEEGNSSTFSYDPETYHVFRALTVKGRSVLCEWSPENKEWACRN